MFEASAYDFGSKEPLHAITFRLIEITPTGKKTVGEFTSDNNSNLYKTTIDINKHYQINAIKDGYLPDSLQFDTYIKHPFLFDLKKRSQLYLHPVNPAAYIPMVLYFANNEPDSTSIDTTTKQEYRSTYVDFIREKAAFIQNATAGLSGKELEQTRDSIDIFFEGDVRRGWNNLLTFSESLYDMLTQGDQVEITLKGYSSPKGNSEYNGHLSARRLSAVLNHFLVFDGGVYKKFIGSGQLVFKTEPYGETKSPAGISDSQTDVLKSIYNVSAARENRVEIRYVIKTANPKKN